MADVFQIVNDHTRRAVESPVSRVLRDGHIVTVDGQTLLLGKNGGEHPIEDSAAPIHDEYSRVFGVVLVFRDVSARRRHERDLLRLAACVESSDDAIITKSLGGIVTSWDPAAERIFGYTAAETIGRPITFLCARSAAPAPRPRAASRTSSWPRCHDRPRVARSGGATAGSRHERVKPA